jgi:hypothetical protein
MHSDTHSSTLQWHKPSPSQAQVLILSANKSSWSQLSNAVQWAYHCDEFSWIKVHLLSVCWWANASLSIQTLHRHTCRALHWHKSSPSKVQVLILSAKQKLLMPAFKWCAMSLPWRLLTVGLRVGTRFAIIPAFSLRDTYMHICNNYMQLIRVSLG